MPNTGAVRRPFTSIIIPTLRKRPDSLKRLLDSIDKCSRNFEILFAEGGDCYSASMNNALKKANGDYLTIPGIADDIEVTKGWLSSAIEYLSQRKKVGACAFKVLRSDGNLESYGGFVCPEQYNLDSLSMPDYAGYMLVKRECFEKVGLMDENFKPIYCEDSDYGLRIWDAGYKIGVCEGTIIHHHEAEGREFSPGNHEYLERKHPKWFL